MPELLERSEGDRHADHYLMSLPVDTPVPRAPNQVLVVLGECIQPRYVRDTQM